MFTAAYSQQSKGGNSLCPTTDEWMNKTWSMHTAEHYSALKREEVRTHATMGMNPESIMRSEISQAQKGEYGTIPVT